MNALKRGFLPAVSAALLLGIATPAFAGRDCVTQFSIIESLLSGVYAGNATVAEIKKAGDFGIGAFNDMDGEMAAANGVFWRQRSNGSAYRAVPDDRLPFATVAFFRPDRVLKAGGTFDFEALTQYIDGLLEDKNVFYAVKVEGEFTAVKTRAPKKQEKPYPPIAEVIKDQAIFGPQDKKGTLVGFRFPAYAKGVNVPGFHFHFISDDGKSGGHVLSLSVKDPVTTLGVKRCLTVVTDDTPEFSEAGFGQEIGAAMKAIEKDPAKK